MKGYKNTMIKNGCAVCCCFALFFSVVLSEPLRQRRQANQNYVIDTLVVVDDLMFSRFKEWFATTPSSPAGEPALTQQATSKMKEYVALVLHQANDRLATLKQHLPYSISLQLVNVIINQNILVSSTGRINSDVALETFQEWISSSGLGPMYDHAILLTGHGLTGTDVVSNTFTIQGRAYVGKMCNIQGFSSSIVEYSGGFQSDFYVAHEVAHSLGSRHDGEASINTCSQSENFIMAASRAAETPENKAHPWYFSTCSAQAIDSYIKNITSTGTTSNVITNIPNCLSTSSTPIQEYTSTANSMAGQLYKADDQCQMIYGSKSKVCLGQNFGNLSDICTSMQCLDPSMSTTSPTCIRHFAAEGTSCGDKKWCRLGQCVYSEAAPQVGECPNGDTVVLVNNQYSCSEFVRLFPSECYNAQVRDACCASCAKIRKDSEVCPYGDKVSGCQAGSCKYVFPDGYNYAEHCCGTCSYDVVPSCVDVSSIDGVTCDVRVEMGGTQNCYNASVAYLCCSTCSSMRRNVRDCEYGDKLVGDYCPSKQDQDWAPLCQDRNITCCASCDVTSEQGDKDAGVQLAWTSFPVAILSFLWICYTNSNYALTGTAL